MTLLAERFPTNPTTASAEGSGFPVAAALASLPVFLYQENRWCEQRGELQPFVFMYEASGGRVGICLGCGGEDAVPFTRVNSEQ